jgi:non-specific serine/threonine protein kinase
MVTDEDLPEVGQICVSLDGLPLAIELAAARTAALGLDTLAQRLSDRHELLDLADGALDPRHRSLRSAVAWSYELLPPEVQVALQRLAVFTGGFSQLSAERILGGSSALRRYVPTDTLERDWVSQEFASIAQSARIPPLTVTHQEALTRLVEANLVQVHAGSDGQPRYHMLESIREYGLEQLRASGNYAETRTAHAIAMLQFMDVAGYEVWYQGGSDSYREQRLEEQGNVRLALAWATEPANNLAALAGRLICSTWYHFQLSGQGLECRMWLERVLTVPNARLWSRVQVMNALSFVCWTQGDIAQAGSWSQSVIEEWKPSAPLQWLGIAHFNAGLIEWRRGDYYAMTEHIVTAKSMQQEAADLNGVGFCNLALGVLARLSGDVIAARSLLDEALDLHSRAGHEWGAATSRYLAGETAHDQGNTAEAASLIAEGLERYLKQSDVYGSGACVAALAVMATERNEPERAARLFGAAFSMSEHAGVVLPPVDLERYQQTAAMVATQVPESAFRIGRGWSFEEATQEALALAAEIAAGRVPGPVDDPVKHMLTADQLDAVNLLIEGLKVDEIAARLYRDPNTIYDRLARARLRLDVASNEQLRAKVNVLRKGNGAS